MTDITSTPQSTIVLVTGSNGDLGTQLVDDFLANGLTVACHYRSSRDSISRVLKGHGLDPDTHTFFADLTSESDVSQLRTGIEERLGPVGALVNLAGASGNGMSWRLSRDDFLEIVEANLLTTFLCSKEFIPGMRERGDGRIVNISSIVGTAGAVGASHYAAAKAGINGFTKSLSLELAPSGTTANSVSVGYFDSGLIHQIPEPVLEGIIDRIPLGRLGSSGTELPPVIRFLISPAASYVTGQVIHVNGGAV